MNQNLETVRKEILAEASSRGLVPFHVGVRNTDVKDAVYWDVEAHPAFSDFLDAATASGVKLLHVFERVFEASQLEESIEDMDDLPFDPDEQRQIEKRLESLRIYDGMMGAIELSFHYAQRDHIFELKTPWWEEYSELLEAIDEALLPLTEMDEMSDEDDEERGDSAAGGYFSKN